MNNLPCHWSITGSCDLMSNFLLLRATLLSVMVAKKLFNLRILYQNYHNQDYLFFIKVF